MYGESYCPLEDDRDQILNKLMHADGTILASPVSSRMISPCIKNFFDRIAFLQHRPVFFGKIAMSLVTSYECRLGDARTYMNKTLAAFGFSISPAIELQFKSGIMPESFHENNKIKVISAVNSFIIKIKKGQIDSPSLDQLISFHLYKYLSVLNPDRSRADFEYYKDKEEYHYDTQIGTIKKLIANRIARKKSRQQVCK
jgi:hypothetical protein